jgi:hypothetical protein
LNDISRLPFVRQQQNRPDENRVPAELPRQPARKPALSVERGERVLKVGHQRLDLYDKDGAASVS